MCLINETYSSSLRFTAGQMGKLKLLETIRAGALLLARSR